MEKHLMKFAIAIITVLITASVCFAGNIDPYLLRGEYLKSPMMKSSGSPVNTSKVSVIIKAKSPEDVADYIKNHDGSVHTIIGNIITASIPKDTIHDLSNLPGIDCIEAAKPLKMNLDESIPKIGANAVHNGWDDDINYRGKGVIVGIIDSGIDYTHDVFKNGDGVSRIISIWDQTIDSAAGFQPPSEIMDSYGIECGGETINNNSCPSYDDVGHGTHVAGIAAGNDDYYRGVAPEAELIVVKVLGKPTEDDYTPSISEFQIVSDRIIDGINYIFSKASALGKPAVVNISMGMHIGAHDGTSLLEEAMNSFIGDTNGRCIVASAGNNRRQTDGYFASIHAGGSFNGETKAYEFHGFDSNSHGLILDIWQPADGTLSFAVGVDDYDSYEVTDFAASGDAVDFTSGNGELKVIIDSTEVNNPLNNKKHTIIFISSVSGDEGVNVSTANYTFDLLVSGEGSFNGWIVDGGGTFAKREGLYGATGYEYVPGDSQYTVGIPATAGSVIAVASYSSKDSFWSFSVPDVWDDYDFTEIGAVSPFSSIGPTVDVEKTGQKPEITAPGEWVVSALSKRSITELAESFAPISDSGDFVAMVGTSMASPHVVGAAALLMERNPDLTCREIEMLLARNTAQDEFTGSVPNNLWGYGKLDIRATMKNFETTDLDTPLPVSDDGVAEVGFNPAISKEDVAAESKSGGCSLINGDNRTNNVFLYFCLLVTVFMFTRFRRKMIFFPVVMIIFVLGSVFISCGGKSDGSNPISVISSASLNLGQQELRIDSELMTASYYSYNKTEYSVVFLAVNLKHYYAGESVEFGAEGYYSGDPDKAVLMVLDYAEKVDELDTEGEYEPYYQKPEIQLNKVWIAVSGTLNIKEAFVSNDRPFSAEVVNAVLRPVDIETGMIDREGAEIILSSSVDAYVTSGSYLPIITDINPLNGTIGTVVRMRGHNLNEDRLNVKFSGCNHAFPRKLVSPNEVDVTIAALCSDTQFKLDNCGSDIVCGYEYARTPQRFDLDLPVVDKISLPKNDHSIKKIVYNRALNRIYILYELSDKLEIYSVSDKALMSPFSLPEPAGLFDVSPDGNYIVIAAGLNLYVYDNQYNLLNTVLIPNGGFVEGLAIGQNDQALVMVSNISTFEKPYIGLLDIVNGTITFPASLELTGGSSSYMRFVAREGNDTVVAYDVSGDTADVEVYRLDTVGNVYVKRGAGYIGWGVVLVHPTKEEIWISDSVYNLDLVLLNNILFDTEWSDSYILRSFSPDGLFVFMQGDGGIYVYDSETTEKLAYFPLFVNGEVEGLGSLNNIYVSGERESLVFVTSDYIYHVGYQELLGWLDNS